MKRLLPLCFGLFLFCTSHAEPFAALTVIPAGGEQFDLSTGVTTLPGGGKIIDKERGLELTGTFIRYEEASYIATQEAVIEGEFGTLSASELFIDLEQDTITASGELSLESGTLLVTAHTLTLFLDANVARLEGEVVSAAPEFQARVVLIDLSESDALLVGPYWFQQGVFTLEQASEDSLLQLRHEQGEKGYDYSPNSQVEAQVLEHLGSYLP